MVHCASSFCHETMWMTLSFIIDVNRFLVTFISPSISFGHSVGLWGWGVGDGGGLKEMWSPTDYRFSAVLVRGWLLQVNVLGKPRWESIYRNPCFFLSKTSCSEKGNGLGVLDVWEQLMGDTSQLTTTQKTENSKELLTASSSTQLPRVSDISGYWLVNTNKSGSNHWACLKEVSLLLQLFLLSLICYSVIWAQFSYAHLVLLCQDRSTLRMCYGIRPHSSLTAYWFIDNSNHL